MLLVLFFIYFSFILLLSINYNNLMKHSAFIYPSNLIKKPIFLILKSLQSFITHLFTINNIALVHFHPFIPIQSLTSSLSSQVMIFSSTKPNRLYTSISNKPYTSVFSDKSYYSNSLPKQKFIEDKPLLSFTSFQHYLEDCNQNDFRKRENERVNRSTNKAKTQAHFNYNREKNTQQAKQKQFNKFALQDGVIKPFYPCQENSIMKPRDNNTNPNRNMGSKSSSDNYYVHKSTMVEDVFDQRFGTIEGWNEEQKIYSNNGTREGNFMSSKSILQERKLNGIMKNRVNKSSQNSFRKQNNKQTTFTQAKQQKPPTTATNKQTLLSSKKTNQSNNKQNLCLIQLTSEPQSPQHLFRPIQLHQKHYTNKINPLTSINQLEEEILVSKRQPHILGTFSSRDKGNGETEWMERENHNIKMLKKEFQYLCREEVEQGWDGQREKGLIQTSASLKNVNKQFKYFKRFPNHQNKQNTTCYQFDTGNPLKTNRPKTTQDQPTHSSSNMLKLLQSINYTTSNNLYQAKTPIKRKPFAHSNINTPHNLKKDDMKRISKQKEKFHESLRDRKSQSAFHCVHGFGESDDRKENDRGLKEKREHSLVITVVKSFKSCDSKTKTKSKINSKNFSLLNNRNSRLLTEESASNKQNSVVKKLKCKSLFQKDFLPEAQQTNSSKLLNDQAFEDLHPNQSMSQTIDLMHSISDHDNVPNEQSDQSLEKLNLLSQQLKKCCKMPITTKYINLANKKFTYLNRAARLNNNKEKRESREERKNVIKNLTITQLEGRHIQKLRKRFDINNP